MLFTLILITQFMLCSSIQASPHDLSWIQGVTLQSKTPSCQNEAKFIVEHALQASRIPQNCAIAEDLASRSKEIAKQNLRKHETNGPREYRYGELLVFVSFSMPMETLKVLAKEVGHVGGQLILRGLVKGNFPDTLKKLQEFAHEILIDPTLFEAYQIKQVPTFVLREKPTEFASEEVKFDTLKGNVTLKYALEQFAHNGDLKTLAQKLLEEMR